MLDVNEFLNQLDNIKSFAGKVRYADENLERIGSGSGRIVYSVDDNKVIKLAKNAKGIAQNEVEAGIGYDYTSKHIVAEVFDNADNYSWILAEKAKKVTEKRIKELTGIPSLWELSNFMSNHIQQNKGRRPIYKQDQELEDFFWENEFSSDLITFAVNYDQSVGDMGRPSTYGEVMKDGQPAIVLTDYGLNDEVLDSHYSRKEKHRIYEFHPTGIRYGDYLGDIGDVSHDVRHGMRALVPAGVGDGDEINEEFVNFVLDRAVYPKQASSRIPQLTDIFHSNLNNLDVILNSVQDPTVFIKNLVALQDYLISHKSYDRQPIVIDEMFSGGGATKFTTDNDVSGDGFPTYNNVDTSPSIRNNLDANSSMYNEELTYRHVDDATKDEFEIGMKIEGVGDKYLNRKYPNQFKDDFESKYLEYSVKDINLTALKIPVMAFRNGQSNKYAVYVNPETLYKFQENVRGVVLENGDYYVCAYETVGHQEIAIALKKNGITTFLTPQDIYGNPNKLILVLRRGLSNIMELSASYEGDDMEFVENVFDKAISKSGGAIKFKAVVSKSDKGIAENNLVGNENSSTFAEINENISALQHLPFTSEIKSMGGQIYSVGGAVRDEFLGKESKDLDVLITGIPLDELGQILTKYGTVKLVGESFGVYKFIPEGSNEEIDIAIPRTETPTGGGGHKDFDIKSDHTLPIEKDLYRRDFTFNAIAKDIDGNIIDPYNGQDDLQNKVIRAVNPEAFSDDPLRMLRAVQFASRFGFTIEPHTMEMIKKSLDSVGNIAMERRLVELEKIQQKGDMRYGAQLLKDTGLFRRLFGYELNQSIIDNAPFEKVNTVGEFIFLILQESQKPEELFKTRIHNITDIYKEIKALKLCFSRHSDNHVHSRMVAHDMYLISPNTLKSQILPNQVMIAANELLSGKYPKTVNELAVDGHDLMELGLQGEEIKKMKNSVLKNIYSDKIINNKEQLLDMVKNDIANMNEELSPETLEKAKKNIPIEYTAITIDELKGNRLLQMFDKHIPDDWKIEDRLHVTIKMGELKDYDPMKNHLGWPIHVMATHIGISDMAIALQVEIPNEIQSKNEIPHITLAYNERNGGRPKHSNEITDWQQLKRPIRIRGIFEEVPFKLNI